MIKIMGFFYIYLNPPTSMKSIFFLIVISFFSLRGFSQELKSSKSLASALSSSAKTHKPVLLVILPPSMVNPPVNSKANFKSGLDEKDVSDLVNENFIVYKTIMTDTSVRSIMRIGNINRYPAYIFLRENSEIFYSEFGNSTDKNKYLSMVQNALTAYKEKSISELEKDVEMNKGSISQLKKLIDARQKIGITNNADLIEQYVSNLTIGDFNKYENVLYILQAGPYVDGTAYKLAYTNRKLIDSLYRNESAQKRIAINRAIISNTMKAAVKDKNVNRAMAAANFERSTWSRDYRAGEKSYNNQMLWYYYTVKDTASYFRTAMYFYDNHYMNISADSIKRIEKKNLDRNLKNSFPEDLGKKIVSKEKMDSLLKLPGMKSVTKSVVGVSSPVSNYANELNNAAWTFYQTGTKNLNYLTKAMLWSRRSIELNPIGSYYDTLAHLLYRLGYFEEAIKTQEDAIEKSKLQGMNPVNLQAELKKMKARQI